MFRLWFEFTVGAQAPPPTRISPERFFYSGETRPIYGLRLESGVPFNKKFGWKDHPAENLDILPP